MSLPGAPDGRYGHSVIWTGTDMIVWGGQGSTSQPVGGGTSFQRGNGGRYRVATNSWHPMSTTGVPAHRTGHTAVWSGNEMLVWGGNFATDAGGGTSVAGSLDDGAVYVPGTDTWRPMIQEGAPSARTEHSAAWTGREMIVWGGNGFGNLLNTGGRYRLSLIADGAVGARQLADGAVGSQQLASGAVQSGNIAVGAVGTGQLANGAVTNSQLAPNAVTGAAIANGAVTHSKLAAESVDTENLADGAVGTNQMQAQSVDSVVLAAGAVTADKIFNGQVTEPKLANGAVTTAKISDGVVTTDKLANGAVSGAKIAVGAVGSNELQNLGVTAEKLAPGAALANLNAAGFTGSPVGSLAASATIVNPLLSAEGYARIGCLTSKSYWWDGATANAPLARRDHTAVWTGTEMIVFGGENAGGAVLGHARKYNPATGEWSNLSTTNVPSARSGHTSVWTGAEMIIWGGHDGGAYLSTGARYNPSSDTWTALAAPPTGGTAARRGHTAVWTGSEMIVWGGYNDSGILFGGFGLRYDPGTDTWSAISLVNAPDGRQLHTAIWTGSRMIVWGGNVAMVENSSNTTSTGSSYDPGTNSWTDTADAGLQRRRHTAIWTGTEMIIFGGAALNDSDGLQLGSAYNPALNEWIPIASASELFPNPTLPSLFIDYATANHTAVWTGTHMIAWGGSAARGATYSPATYSWEALPDTKQPVSVEGHSAVWTGSEMILFGGDNAEGSTLPSTSTLSPGQDMFLFRK